MERANSNLELKSILQNSLLQIQQKNKSYSLRAFARSLGVSHSALSLFFRGKRKLSYEATEKLRKRFNLGTEIRATTPKKRKSSLELDTLFSQLELDQYELISDWENYAILSLASLSHFEMSPENISRHLNISLERATHSFQLLIRLGFLKKSRNGKWIQATAPLKVDNSISTKATREAQKKIIHKSLESLENDPIEERDFNAVMMAIDESLVPLAKEKIKDFRRKLMLELEGLGGANRAYIFSMQFFPVSKKHEAYSK